MFRTSLFVAAILLAFGLASPTAAQEWRPPTRQMPEMPRMAELAGDWLASRSDWFAGVAAVAGVQASQLRAVGEAPRGSSEAQVVRFSNGPLPVVVWQDRNGDGRADIIEIYRGAGVIIQVIDADYDGMANVIRRYDPSGTLTHEERL